MIFRYPLDEILGNKLKLRILRQFCITDGEFTAGDLARICGYSHTYAIEAMRDLESNGLVKRRNVGRAHLYSLNQDHMFVIELKRIFELEQNSIMRVLNEFHGRLKENLNSVVVFGSVARGEERPNSDLDLLLILNDDEQEDTEDMVLEVSNLSTAITGSNVSPITVSAREFEEKRVKRDIRGMWKEDLWSKPVMFVDYKSSKPRLTRYPEGRFIPSTNPRPLTPVIERKVRGHEKPATRR